MGNNKELLLVYTSMKDVSLSNSVNVMLTPQFYTLKRETLPIKYAYQAKKIAPSLFNGLLELESSYSYMVFKEEENWIFIAYDEEKISAFLISKGIKLEQVSKLFFAQQLLPSFSAPILLGEKDALVVLDNTVVVVPQVALDEEVKPLVLNNNHTPKSGMKLSVGTDAFISMRQVAVWSTVFILFAGMFFIEGWRYSHNSQNADQEAQKLLEAYPALQSQMKRKNIAIKYTKIDTAERQKREVIKSLSGMIFKGVTFISFSLNEKHFTSEFSCSNNKVAKRLSELAKKAKFKTSIGKGNNNVQIEGAL